MKRLITAATILLGAALILSACGAPAYTTRPTITVPSTTTPPTIGFSPGGAKDVGNFRENIVNDYLPLPTDVTVEGLFYDYFFDTGAVEPTDKLYSPSYSYAVTRDPISGQTEYYLSVGLNSGLTEADFARKKLNLVIVLDISGSMSERYNQYYYDRLGRRVDAYADEGIVRKTKMESAAESVVSILDQLGDDDRFAIVTFNGGARLERPMGLVSSTNMREVRNRVLDIVAGGSTNLAAGMELGTDQFKGLREVDSYEFENRMIVLTDAQPNTGDFSSSGLEGIARVNAGRRIYTTVIGIGVDFNTQLIEQITKIRGANYYSVHSPREFRQRVVDEFDFMVTPLVFNLRLNFESDGWRIEKVFGSPEADAATGSLMKVNTLFPAKAEGGEVRGGLVLLKLRKTSSRSGERVYLTTTYEDRNGRTDGDESVIYLESEQPEYFDNTGIRKGVLLARYACLLQNWMLDERQYVRYNQPWNARVREDTGIVIPAENVGQWERTSLPLTVSQPYRTVFGTFADYFAEETRAIGDSSLEQELDVLDRLTSYSTRR